MFKNYRSPITTIKTNKQLKSNLLVKKTINTRLKSMTAVLSASNDLETFKAILTQLMEYTTDKEIKGTLEEVKYIYDELDNFLISYLHKSRKEFYKALKLNTIF